MEVRQKFSGEDEMTVEDAIQLVEMQSNRYNLSEDLKCILKNTLINHYSRMSKISKGKDNERKHNLHMIDILA